MFRSVANAIRYFRSDNRVVQLYDEMLGDGLARDGDREVPALNMGYWRSVPKISSESIHEANAALFDLVADGAGLSASDQHVVDVGCGCAANIERCLERFPILKMTGLNISPRQADWGNRYLAKMGRADRGEVVVGSATNMPFADQSVDKMVSVEAAFHFDTRERFFQEAKRVLKPGGILSLADLIVCRPRSWMKKMCVKSIMNGLSVPAENIYDFQDYLNVISNSGLNVLDCVSIAGDVIGPFNRWFWARPMAAVCRYNLFWSMACSGFTFADLDYLHVVAQRPT